MGLRDFFDRKKKEAEDRLNPPKLSPEQEKQRRKDDARKTFEQMNRAIELAKKGLKIRSDVKKKKKSIQDSIDHKTIAIADKAAPIAQKIDSTLGTTGKKEDKPKTDKTDKPGLLMRGFGAARKGISTGAGAIGAGAKAVKDGAGKLADTAQDKIAEQRAANAKKPTTGSGLLDFLAPAVPHTDATKPKAETPKPAPAPKKPKK